VYKMTELREGLILTVDQAKNGSFTFKGKEVKLEQDKNNPLVFTGQTKLTKDEVKAGNLNTAFTYNAGIATGVVNSYLVIPDTEEFKNLNDAEKITKLNSIEYQFGTEPTDDGKQLDHVLQNSVDTTPAQDKQQQQQTIKLKKEKEKEAAESEETKTATAAAGTTTSLHTQNKDNLKSGDKIQVNKQ